MNALFSEYILSVLNMAFDLHSTKFDVFYDVGWTIEDYLVHYSAIIDLVSFSFYMKKKSRTLWRKKTRLRKKKYYLQIMFTNGITPIDKW